MRPGLVWFDDFYFWFWYRYGMIVVWFTAMYRVYFLSLFHLLFLFLLHPFLHLLLPLVLLLFFLFPSSFILLLRFSSFSSSWFLFVIYLLTSIYLYQSICLWVFTYVPSYIYWQHLLLLATREAAQGQDTKPETTRPVRRYAMKRKQREAKREVISGLCFRVPCLITRRRRWQRVDTCFLACYRWPFWNVANKGKTISVEDE